MARSSSSAGGYFRTSISVPRLLQHVVPDKQKLRTSISVPRLPQHLTPPPPAPAPSQRPAAMTLQSQHKHSHSLDELQSSRPEQQLTRRDLQDGAREVLLWVYTQTTKLYLFSTAVVDSVSSVHDFLHRTQKLNPSEYELAVLTPGLLYPVLLQNFKSDLYNGVVLCLPSSDISITIQTQEKEVFSTQAHPLDNIEDIKLRIEEIKGYPIALQDLMLDGHILRNEESVLDYHISQETRLFLVLQSCKKFPVYVDTFWGVKYTVEVGSCTTVNQVIQMILRKTMRHEDEASDFHARVFMRDKPMYEGLIRLETANNIMKENLCLGYCKVSKGAILRLTSTGEANKDNCRMVQVLLENGVTVHTNAAKYDNWHIVVLKLHGITGKPIDTMRLHVNDNLVELNCTIGTLKQTNDVTYAKLATLRTSTSMANNAHSASNGKLQLEVKTVNGITESVQCSAKDTIHDVKLKLEKAGVPEARYCDVLYKKVKLPTNSKLMDYKLQGRTQMELKMGEFPVQVMWATNTVKLTAQSEQPISDLLARIETKTGASPIKAAITFAGRNLYDTEDMVIQDSTLYVHSTIYVEPLQTSRVLHLVTVDDVIPIPIRPNIDSLHLHQLTHLHLCPEIFLKSLHWFIKWRFPSRRVNSKRSCHSEATLIPSKQRAGVENATIGRSLAGATSTAKGGDIRLTKPRRILDQRSRTMPILSLNPRDVNQNHPLRQSFDFTDLNNTLRESSRSVVQIRSSSLDRRDRSLDRLTSVVNIRDNSPIRRERSLDRAHDRARLPVDPHLSVERPAGVTVFLPNLMHTNSDEMSSSLTPSSNSGSPSSIKSASGITGGSGAFYNGFPPTRSESFPRRTHRQLPMLPNDMSPSSTPDSTPASKKKLQVRFELPTENGGSNGDTWDKSGGPVKSALKKGTKLYAPLKSTPNYGMTISARSRSVDYTDYAAPKPPWNKLQRSKTVVEYYSDQNSH